MQHLPRHLPEPAPARWKTEGLSVASRVTFSAVLFPWLMISGISKLAGFPVSVGPAVGALPLSLGAYYTYLPGTVEDLSVGLPEVSLVLQVLVSGLVLLELALPVLLVAGWQARWAAGMLMLHQLVLSALTLPATGAGAIYDARPFDMMPDQVLLWMILLAPVALFGAGPLSVDRYLHRRRLRPPLG